MATLQKIRSNDLCSGSTINEGHFHKRLKTLELQKKVLARATFNDIHALKIRINGHDEDMDVLDQAFKDL